MGQQPDGPLQSLTRQQTAHIAQYVTDTVNEVIRELRVLSMQRRSVLPGRPPRAVHVDACALACQVASWLFEHYQGLGLLAGVHYLAALNANRLGERIPPRVRAEFVLRFEGAVRGSAIEPEEVDPPTRLAGRLVTACIKREMEYAWALLMGAARVDETADQAGELLIDTMAVLLALILRPDLIDLEHAE